MCARISTYPRDTFVTGLDKWIGTDANTENLATKNFTANAVADYFNRTAIIDTGSFSWQYAPYSTTQPQAEKSFQQIDRVAQNISITGLAAEPLRVSALTMANTMPRTFIINEWVGQAILVHVPSGPSQYAIYNVVAVTPDTEWFFLLDLEFVSGTSGSILEGESLVFGFWSGANVVTSLEATFPIIATGDNDVVISLDPTTNTNWNTAYNRSLVSASVTGTTTKTLTLNKQDGGTITASWVDQNTDTVLSVFGRTGAIVAQSGDYTTTLVTEGTNLYFTTARARGSVSATTPLLYNSTTGVFSIQLSSATQNGYLSSTDWTTFNSKESFVTPGTTSQYWRGDKTWQNLTTTPVAEGTNLYFTDQRARNVISSSITGIDYSNTTGIFSLTTGYFIPTTSQSSQWNTAYNRSITSAAVTGTTTKTLTLNKQDGGTITASWTDDNTNLVTSVFGRTGAVVAQSGDYTTTLVTEGDNLYFTTARARGAISLTTTGTSGPATYSSSTGILNIPQYQGGVTSFNTRTGAITLTSTDVTDALGFTPENVANKSNNTALGTSATLYPTQNAVKVYVDSATAGGIILQGDWNAATNVPDITATTQTGFAWRVSVAGNTNLGGITDWLVNDLAVKSATGWIKIDNTESVTSVFGRFGTVVAQSGDYNTDLVTEGTTNLYFTTARARASISAGSGIAYNSTTGVISSTSGGGSVTSVGLSMPSAFTVTNSPVTTAGTLTVTGAGDTTQYIAGDGSLVTFPSMSTASTLIRGIRNNTGATLTKGTVIYISGATGNRPTVSKAIATGDTTSAQTFGLVQADIANEANGNVVCIGDLTGLNTSAFDEGDQLYLSSTVAGAYTTVKQYAPNHLVYIGIITRSHPTQGQIEVNIQNGYELDELHNVSARNPANNDIIAYNTTTSLWEKKSIATTLGYTPANAATTLTINGTGYDLSANRTWSVGTVTSIGLALGTSGTDANISNSPITTTGEITLNLPTASATNRGLLSNGDWTTFNNKQTLLNGNGFVRMSATTVSYVTGTSSQFVKADGTLDSNAYLPLSGGTLTGALSGTTATFSSSVTATAGANTYAGGALILRSSAGTNPIYLTSNSGFFALSNGGGADHLLIASTGAATFSSSVTATQMYLPSSAGSSGFLQFTYSTANAASRTWRIINDDVAYGDFSIGQSTTQTGTSFTKRLYISNGGMVGIGTTSPQTLLSIETSGTQNTISPIITSQSSGTTYTGLYSIRDGAGDQRGLIFQVYTANVGLNEKMRITSAGNVGIGTNAPTDYSGYTTLHINGKSGGNGGLLRLTASDNSSSVNIYAGGSAINFNTTAAVPYVFLTQDTERMRITSGGNVGIGTTAPNSLLTIAGSNYAVGGAFRSYGNLNIYTTNSEAQNMGGSLTFGGTANNAEIYTYAAIFGKKETTGAGSALGYLSFATDDNNNLLERMRITSGGNVGIGTTSPSNLLSVQSTGGTTSTMDFFSTGNSIKGHIGMFANNFYITSNWFYNGSQNADSTSYAQNAISFDSSGFMSFQTSAAGATSPTERMRIDSTGNLIFTGQSSSKIQFYNSYSGSPANVGLALFNTSGTTVIALNANGGSMYSASLGTGTVYSSGGTLTNTNPSDTRLKDNITNISWGLKEIMDLRPVNYTWKEDTINQGIQFGFIAQEVQEIMPEAIKEFGEDVKYLGLEKDAIYATLVKAIQEQQSQIEELKQLINK